MVPTPPGGGTNSTRRRLPEAPGSVAQDRPPAKSAVRPRVKQLIADLRQSAARYRVPVVDSP
jgi:hypothetical protein